MKYSIKAVATLNGQTIEMVATDVDEKDINDAKNFILKTTHYAVSDLSEKVLQHVETKPEPKKSINPPMIEPGGVYVHEPFGKQPTAKMINFLLARGYTPDEAQNMSYDEAYEIIGRLAKK